MRLRAALLCAIGLTLCVQGSQASSIGVFFAPDGSDCDGIAAAGSPFTLYVGAVLGGDAAAGGITGAEFRLDGVDPAWSRVISPSPAANLSLGNPIGGGCNIAFPACQPGPYVHLYTIELTAIGLVSPTTFAVRRHAVCSDCSWPCALVTKCDAPIFTKVCVAGGQAFLNDPSRACSVGVQMEAWSTVKALYK